MTGKLSKEEAAELRTLHIQATSVARVEIATALHDEGLPPGFDSSHVRVHRIEAEAAFDRRLAELTEG